MGRCGGLALSSPALSAALVEAGFEHLLQWCPALEAAWRSFTEGAGTVCVAIAPFSTRDAL
eukprot:1787109-Lingulodinium_polyedra.AAC.1